jgi:hypothetical protein
MTLRMPDRARPERRSLAALIALVPSLAAVAVPPARAGTTPWPRTETREACSDTTMLRRPFFGDLHVHTRYSADAYIFGTRVGPRDAYAFSRGGEIPVSDDGEAQTRTARLDRPLDFAAVTDHAEFFGEVSLCSTPGSAVYDEELCRLLRQAEDPDDRFPVTVSWLLLLGTPTPPTSAHAFCTLPGVDCDAAAVSVWQDIQAAAEEAYDRTAACTFTTFNGYEHTPSPVGRHLHRNVIFRNERVTAVALSHLETFPGGTPQGLWSALETQCLGGETGCDVLVIPHNSNLSGGLQFQNPPTAAEAAQRKRLEPLVEIHQVKGNSECRFDRLAGAGVGGEDELCTFEQDPDAHQGPSDGPPSIAQYPPRNLVRNVLKAGLRLEQTLGVNPFQMGFIGSTDTHNGNAGDVDEANWVGAQGNEDSSAARKIDSTIRTNPGGLAVVWAEENSRDALFEGLRRRETYATSGTRPVVRFFAGELSGVRCGRGDFVPRSYQTGTPMGGEVGPARGRLSPRFAVWAAKDPGTSERPGTDLQRIQIVKGWVDGNGATHERVFDIAGGDNGAGVDPVTCEPSGAGETDLCAIWVDPTFLATERAFYYARVLENPTCRWSTRVCRLAGVDPLAADCAAQAAAAGPDFADCCLGPATDAFMEPVVQERAWTSPVWYRPDGVAELRARLRSEKRPGRDRLRLRLALGEAASLRPDEREIVVRVVEADTIWSLSIPPGTLRARGGGAFVHPGGDQLDGLASLTLRVGERGGARLSLATARLDLGGAERTDGMVTVSLESGGYAVAETRLWTRRGRALGTGGTVGQ